MKPMAAALIVENGKILLVHNTKHGGLRIEPPGGKKEDGESFEECVVREVEEELGVLIKPLKLFCTYSTQSPEGEFNVKMYVCEIVSGEIELKEIEKISDYGWYDFDDLLSFKEQGVLVPNLVSALEVLRGLL